jgi:hypothetical protein
MDFLGIRDGRPAGRTLSISVTVRCLLLFTPAFVVLGALFVYGLSGFDTSGRGLFGACEFESQCGHPFLLLSVASGLAMLLGVVGAARVGANHSGARRPIAARAALTGFGVVLIGGALLVFVLGATT